MSSLSRYPRASVWWSALVLASALVSWAVCPSPAEARSPGTWTVTGSLAQSRFAHTATRLLDGRVLVAGGRTSGAAGSALDSAELYNPQTGGWSSAGHMTVARADHQATLLADGRVLVTGGDDGYSYDRASAELYDPATGQWHSAASMHEGRYRHAAVLLRDGRVAVAGGWSGAGTRRSAEIYDPARDAWTRVDDMHVPRADPAFTLLPDGRLLVAGGESIRSSETLDPDSGSWTEVGAMAEPRWQTPMVTLHDGRAFVAGGRSGRYTAALASSERFDACGGWTPGAALATARSDHSMTALTSGRVLVAGGVDSTFQLLSSSELYDPVTDRWTPTGALHEARIRFTATPLADGRVLVVGGQGISGYLGSAEIYTPVAGQPPGPTATMTCVGSSDDTSVWGQPVTFTATVTGTPTPSGTIGFAIDGNAVGSPVTLDSHGHAAITASSLTVGTHVITAAYEPAAGTSSEPSAATPLNQIVGNAETVTSVAVAPDPTAAGQLATFTARVSVVAPGVGTPGGSVQFTESDGTPIDEPQELVAGSATLVVPAGAGVYTVYADYSGATHYNASSGSVRQTVNRADTTTTITTSENPVVAGGELTLTVMVSTLPPGDVQPGGSISLLVDGEDVSGDVPLFDAGPGTAGVAVTVRVPTTPQSATIGAVYYGDWDTNPSASPTFVQRVIAPPAATQPSPRPAPPAVVATTASALRSMTAKLTSALRRTGLAALTDTRQVVTVAAPGRLTQSVYTPSAPRSATNSKVRAVLIAQATRTFKAAGTGTVKLRLTAAGRRQLRRAKSLKLDIVTRFTPTAGETISVRDRLLVKRHPAKSVKARADGAWHVTRIRR